MARPTRHTSWRDYVPPAGSRSTRTGHSAIPERAAAPHSRSLNENKFHAEKTIARDGTKLDSAHEAKLYQDLLFRERAGEITELQRQVAIPLFDNGLHITTVRVDFVYRDRATGALVYLEAKSKPTRTRAYVMSRKLLFSKKGIKVVEG
jgi:hypothetical protein